MSIRHFTLCVSCGVAIAACATSTNKDLDDAREALNSGDYTAAIAKATTATQADSTNIEAFLLLNSAYSGRAGIDLLEITKDLTDTANSDTAFDVVHDTLFTAMTSAGCAIGTCLGDLDSAITTLTGFTGTVGNYDSYWQKQYYFQLGILQYVQALGLPTLTAQPSTSGTITPTDITAANNTTAQNDFINGYANLTNSTTGIPTTNSLATTLSKNYCVLKNASVTAGTASGINVGVLRDLSLCQLTPTPATAVTSTVANCAAFNFAACTGTTAPAL